MAVNKIVYRGTALVDLTNANLAADKIVAGYKGYGATGQLLEGTCPVAPTHPNEYTAADFHCYGADRTGKDHNIFMKIPVTGYYRKDTWIGYLDPNLAPANIKAGVQIGSTVKYTTGTFTSDATATAADIASGKTAYVNGSKITGSYSPPLFKKILNGFLSPGQTVLNIPLLDCIPLFTNEWDTCIIRSMHDYRKSTSDTDTTLYGKQLITTIFHVSFRGKTSGTYGGPTVTLEGVTNLITTKTHADAVKVADFITNSATYISQYGSGVSNYAIFTTNEKVLTASNFTNEWTASDTIAVAWNTASTTATRPYCRYNVEILRTRSRDIMPDGTWQ